MCFPFCTGGDGWSRWGLREGLRPGPGVYGEARVATQTPTKLLRRTASTLGPSMNDLKKLRRKTPPQKPRRKFRPGPAPARWRAAPTFRPKTPRILRLRTKTRFPRTTDPGDLLFFSRSVVSDSLRSHGLQHARLPCPHLREFVQTHIHCPSM